MTPSPFRTPFGPRLTAFVSVFTMVALAACADNPVAPGEQKVDQISAPADAVTTPLADSAATGSDSTVTSASHHAFSPWATLAIFGTPESLLGNKERQR